MKLNKLNINIPINFNLIMIKKLNEKILIIYNEEFKFTFIFYKKKISINTFLNNLILKNKFLNKEKYVLKNNFFNFLEKINNFYFIKIKFKGKGYKIWFNKEKKIIIFYFGHSHITMYMYKNVLIKKINKYKIILLKNNIEKLNKIGSKTVKVKKINFYTNRGVRLSKQFIHKRKGKTGAAI